MSKAFEKSRKNNGIIPIFICNCEFIYEHDKRQIWRVFWSETKLELKKYIIGKNVTILSYIIFSKTFIYNIHNKEAGW